MEDILASIRRIIAEDQSNSLGRATLGGLTRRVQPPLPVTEDQPAPARPADALPTAAEPHAEADAHAAPREDPVPHAYEAHAYEMPGRDFERDAAPFDTEVVADPADHGASEDLSQGHVSYGAEQHPPAMRDEAAPSPGFEDEPHGLVSAATGASITSSFQTLAESVMLQDPDLIERVLRESMRPLLKAWLDDHLPSIVERLVRVEIERVARGGRARNT